MYHQLDDDRPKDECGVFGIYGQDDAAAITTLGLHALSSTEGRSPRELLRLIKTISMQKEE